MTPRHLLFGPFVLDLAEERLLRDDRALPLSYKAHAVLRHLAENAGRLLGKEELLAAVWPDTHVGPAVLKVCVREIRLALGDTVAAPRYIETVRLRGYRFIASVREDRGARIERVEPARAAPAGGGPGWGLVGRVAERQALEEALASALRGAGQVVLLTGMPGIGKTALADAFLASIEGPTALVLQARCLESVAAGEPFLPVLDALGRLARSAQGGPLLEVLRAYAPSWVLQIPWLCAPEQRAQYGGEIGPPLQARMLREMSAALEALAEQVPLVLLLEDLHHCDAATVALLGLLAQRAGSSRLLLLGTCRAGALDEGGPLAALQGDLAAWERCRVVPLSLLSVAEVGAYLQARFPGLAGELTAWAYRRTGGHPRFLRELVEHLVAQGHLAQGAAGWSMAGPPDALGDFVPRSTRRAIEQQIAQSGGAARRTLEAASVAGLEFNAALVAAALGESPRATEERCERLVRCGFLLRTAGPGELPDGAVATRYAFLHEVYRRVLRQGTAAVLARRYELRMARCLSAAGGEGADAPAAPGSELARSRRAWGETLRLAREAATLQSTARLLLRQSRLLRAAERLTGDARDA